MKNTITQQEAERRVDAYAQGAGAAFPSTARLEVSHRSTTRCDDPTDHGPLGRVNAGVSYKVRGLSEPDMPQYFNSFAEWLARNDFVILTDKREVTKAGAMIWAENKHDAFRIILDYIPGVDPTISVGSPCVWPDGTPAPEGPSIQ